MNNRSEKTTDSCNNIANKLFLFLKKIIIVFGIAFFAILFLATLLVSLIYSDDYTLTNYTIKFSFFSTSVGLLLFLCLFFIKPLRSSCLKIKTRKLASFALIWGLCFSVVWILIANVKPMWDSQDLVYASDFLRGIHNNYTISKWVGNSAYLARFPFNTSIVALLYFCYLIAGENQILLFELMSCVACAFTMFLTVKLTDELFKKRLATVISTILVTTFMPLILYCTFVYGNIICLPFALGAILMQVRAIKNTPGTKPFRKYFFFSYFLIACSIFFKSTMLFPAIAITLVWLFVAMQAKRKALVAISIVAFLLAKNSILPLNYIIEQFGDGYVNLHNGTPMIAWVAMGTGASKEYFAETRDLNTATNDTRFPGFFDNFVWIPGEDETYNKKNISKISIHYLKKRIVHFANDPLFAIEYFAKKLAIEWTEPTFESFVASNWCREDMDYIACKREYTPMARYFYYGRVNKILVYIMDVQQTLFSLGCLIALWKTRKKVEFTKLALIICILGMALVYLFWENKSQYIFPIYLFMIPVASYGLSILNPPGLWFKHLFKKKQKV